MIPSFTGSARPRRQVNLSGRNSNPFAVHSTSPNASSSQSANNAVVQAQRERRQRQLERERPPAAVKIQKVWRGHRGRNTVKDQWRKQWDENEERDLDFRSTHDQDMGIEPNTAKETIRSAESKSHERPPYRTGEQCLAQLKLLVQFTSPDRPDDLLRVLHFQSRYDPWLRPTGKPLARPWDTPLSLLARLLASIVGKQYNPIYTEFGEEFLSMLRDMAVAIPARISPLEYYRAIATEVRRTRVLMQTDRHSRLIQSATQTLLSSTELSFQNSLLVYKAFIREVLTIPELSTHLELGKLSITYKTLTVAMVETLSSLPEDHESLLWLLAHFIYFGRQKRNQQPDAEYVKVISSMTSVLATDIESRLALDRNFIEDDDNLGKERVPPLSPFVEEQLSSLVNQESISSLLVHLQAMSTSLDEESEASRQTSALATYVLTLLRVFPRRGDDIRMWLFFGGATSVSNDKVPAIKFFYEAIRSSKVYVAIKQDPQEAISLLRADSRASSRNPKSTIELRNRNWRVILIFMELYAFVLRITDDEEFLSGSASSGGQESRTRQSALAIEQISDLTVFLKHLAFAMYWHTSEILGVKDVDHRDSIAAYFSTKSDQAFKSRQENSVLKPEESSLAGMPGMTLAYLKDMVTGLLRMIYERDSRRKFLPSGHWLMTKYFDMDEFISAVVREEAERQMIEESYETASENPQTDDNDREAVNLVGTSRTQRLRDRQRLDELQYQRARQRYLASVTPRIEILQNMPFFIPFATRVHIFRRIIYMDQKKRRGGYDDPDDWRFNMMTHNRDMSRHRATVHRDSIFDDAFEQFFPLGEGLKEPIQIKFVDSFGTEEEGIDGGGVTKEFLTSVTNETFNATSGLEFFVENDQHLLYPNPSAVDERRDFLTVAGLKETDHEYTSSMRDLLKRYEFLGRIVGKCLYEGILVDVHFAPFFLLKWALTGGTNAATGESSYRANINDLRDLDEGLYQGLLKLKNYPGNVEDFSLTFEIDDTISQRLASSQSGTRTITRELRPNGSSIPVTNQNRPVYISDVARHRLQIQPRVQTSAFLRGLGDIVSPSWLSMFNQGELQTLLSGSKSEISIADLRANTQYGGVYVVGDDGQEHPTVRLFWTVLTGLEDADRRKVLKFVTSTPRAPLLGFEMLNPRFSIRDAGNDQSRLPTTSTCVNLLKLPVYKSEAVLKERLLYSVNAGAGFNLS
ncbi:MAG: hypothetical protein Q9191_006808 [Dirinaria sp. TL-2023a]